MLFSFGDIALDADKRELRRGAKVIPIEPQVFDLLEYLVRHRHRVVTREDLLREIWQGRIVSESTLNSRINAARSAIGDSGEMQRLIKTLPRKGILFVGNVAEGEALPDNRPVQTSAKRVPRSPTIAVLPFENLGADCDKNIAIGLAQDIVLGLSRCSTMHVVLRLPPPASRLEPQQIGSESGVDYFLTGSVQRHGDEIRITTQLTDAESAFVMWAEKFDGSSNDVFSLQNQIAELTAAIVEPKMVKADAARVQRKHPRDLAAYDLWLQAIALMHAYDFEAALSCAKRATLVDPTYALAHAAGATCHSFLALEKPVQFTPAAQTEGRQMAHRAVELEKEDPVVLWMAGFSMWILGLDGGRARELLHRALIANPASIISMILYGWVEAYAGNSGRAISLIEHAAKLDRNYVHAWMMSVGLAVAHLAERNFEDATVWAERAFAQHPKSAIVLRALIVALANAGRLDESRRLLPRLLEIEPGLTISQLQLTAATNSPDLLETFRHGLRKAGMRE